MKPLGLLLIFLSASAAGFVRANGYRETEKEIGSFIKLMYFIKHEISFYLTPQSEIYGKFSDAPLERNGFLPMLRRFSSDGTEAPLLRAISECDTLKCGDEVMNAIKDFAQTLGTLSAEEQCERCDITVNVLNEIYKSKREEATEKSRLCRSVGCMAGLGLVLLLW